jgi:predicted nucleic acid-binding protein
MADALVVDASAIFDVVVGNDLGASIEHRLRDHDLHVPAHADAEVLSALGRWHRSGRLTADQVSEGLRRVAGVPLERHPLPGLLAGAWRRRHSARLVDALYLELAEKLDTVVVTTDGKLAAATPLAELVL